MKQPFPIRRMLGIGLVCAMNLLPTLRAEQFGDFTYELINGGTEVAITDYPWDHIGPVTVPGFIDAKPVTSIGSSAFASCYGVTGITLPSSIVNIGNHAFGYCSSLTGITIPASVATIGEGVFSGCDALQSISVEAGNTSYTSIGGVLFNAAQSELIACPNAKSGAYVIPAGVTSISARAFYGCSNLTSIAIPAGVLSIGGWAFYDCYGLTSIHIPTSVETIGTAAFLSCNQLGSISADPGNTHFAAADGVLFNSDQTELVACPGGKTGPYVIPSSVAVIRSSAFAYCSDLTGNMTVPDSVTSIEDYTFRGCRGLSGITLPSGLTGIGHSAFKSCSGLTSIAIPANVATIGHNAFHASNSLKSAVFLGNAPTLGINCFGSASAEFTVYFLPGSSGFSTPTWQGYPSEAIDETTYPAALWLLAHGLAQDTPLDQDLNGDGVDLLMAYALDLDPNQNLSGSVTPHPTVFPGIMTITFHVGSPGVSYIVETTTDLQSWTTAGVTLTGSSDTRTAIVVRDGPRRFLRLRVE